MVKAVLPEMSIARHALCVLAEERNLASFARAHGIEGGNKSAQYIFLWQIKEGIVNPSLAYIVLFSDAIPIMDWFLPYSPTADTPDTSVSPKKDKSASMKQVKADFPNK